MSYPTKNQIEQVIYDFIFATGLFIWIVIIFNIKDNQIKIFLDFLHVLIIILLTKYIILLVLDITSINIILYSDRYFLNSRYGKYSCGKTEIYHSDREKEQI